MRFTQTALLTVCMFAALQVLLSSPLPAAGSLEPVKAGVRIHNLSDVDELHERWQVTGSLITSWMEPKLKYRAQDIYHDHRDISPHLVHTPNIGFANATSSPSLHQVDLFVRPDGRVFMVQSFEAALSTHLDLRSFPFDVENLPIFLVPLGHDVDRIVLIPDAAQSQWVDASYSGLSQWQFLGLTARPYAEHYFGDTQNGVKFTLQVRRNAQSYVWKFILPLCLIVVVSWISFWLSPADFKSKDLLGTAVTTLLIIVAFTLSITALLPRTSYLTYIDAFLLTCFLFVVAAIVSIVAINAFELKGSEARALSLRKIAGIVLPLGFVVVQIAVLVFFRS